MGEGSDVTMGPRGKSGSAFVYSDTRTEGREGVMGRGEGRVKGGGGDRERD